MFFVIIDFIFVIFCLTSSYLLGLYLFKHKLFTSYHDTSKIKKILIINLFSLTFAFSTNMFILIIFEIFNLMEPESRWLNWRFDIIYMMIVLIYIFPLLIIYQITYQLKKGIKRYIVVISLFIIHIYMFFNVNLKGINNNS